MLAKYTGHKFLSFFLFLSICGTANSTSAEPEKEAQSIESAPEKISPKPAQNMEELTQFIDGYVESMINDFEPPGMIVSVVIGDKKITKGYGIANMETGEKNNKNTMFRIGSISKLFVWLSAHKLADEGQLEFDTDINEYLGDISVQGGFEKPITMRDLMAHRPGFDDNLRDFLDPNRDMNLHDAVARNIPLRVANPGERASYSNTGTNIAAYIVERISGVSFYQYVDENILKPIGLNSTSLRDPEIGRNKESLEANMAKPHKLENGIAEKINYMAVRPQEPVGAVAMDAVDAAVFMRMLLDQTRYSSGQLMSKEAWLRITKPAFDDAIGSDDMGWGFMLNDVDGLATVGHGGATQFLSWMFVVPELDMGVFISSNMNSPESRGDKLAWSIVRRVMGKDATSDFLALKGLPQIAKAIEGDYLNNRRPQNRGISLFGVGTDIKVKATDDGYLVMPGTKEVRYAPLNENVWVSKAGKRLRIVKDDMGNILRIHTGLGSSTLERISFISTKVALIIGFGGVFLFSITSLLGMYYRHGRGVIVSRLGKKMGWISISSVVLWLTFFVVAIIAVGSLANLDISEIDNSSFPPMSINLLFYVTILLLIQSLVHVVGLIPIWSRSGWTLWRRIHSTVYAMFAIFAVYLMHHWNIIGGSIYGL